jgi:hypothetical protein
VENRKVENGKWKMENGKWKMENGKWKMENGKWKMENLLLRAKKINQTPNTNDFLKSRHATPCSLSSRDFPRSRVKYTVNYHFACKIYSYTFFVFPLFDKSNTGFVTRNK